MLESALLLLFVVVTVVGVTVMMRPRAISVRGPNNYIGIRTMATRHSAETWDAAHTVAWPYMVRSAIAALAMTGILLIALVTGDLSSDGAAIGSGVAVFLWSVLLCWGAYRGHQAAQRIIDEAK